LINQDELIQIEKSTRWYGQVIGVNDVSLTIGPGVTGLLGPNGAGKSTLMKLITGQIRPNQGTVTVGGLCPFQNYLSKKRVGYLPEMDVLPDRMTGERFLLRCALLRGYSLKEAGAVVQEALALTGLTQAAHKKAGAYSRGMRQRLQLAQAVLHNPDFIILDEPLTGLDPVGRREVINLIRKLGKRGHAVLVSSHVLYEVELMTDQVVLIVRGKVLAEGTIEHIRSLLDSHPHTVDLKTPDPSRLAVALLEKESIVSVSLEAGDNRLQIKTRRPDDFYTTLEALIIDGGFEVESLHSPDNNLQAVFDYLVK